MFLSPSFALSLSFSLPLSHSLARPSLLRSCPHFLFRSYLDKIAQRLAALAPATKVVFGITTPEMCSKATDDIVQSNNVNTLLNLLHYFHLNYCIT